ncbi:aminotransferase class IV [Cellulomonas alba]|uniref:Aminotransferase class IV n=1 Tax=Cellulomonas alba TaxID=3053467 RepID=A0ABT7SBB6_9CELL|nr:aminotransferase class IV [Cellulomonas alba]MDM7853478.1 aminotransferase class IV [Cellulomonas alba]
MSIVIWSDGRLHSPDAPLVAGIDHGLTVGDGVFETLGVRRGQPFALTRHLRRLRTSALGLGLGEPDEQLVRDGVAVAMAAAGPDAGRVRITVTGGAGPLGSGRFEPDDQRQTVVVLVGPGAPTPLARVVRVPWVRNERSAVAGLKTTSYAENVVALAAATRRGADEAILANTLGLLCEGTGSNVVVERDGELLTPPLTSGCLAGITRELLLEWAPEAGIAAREADLPYAVLDDVLAGTAQLAVTGSVRNVSPVVALDEVEVEPGEVSLAARAAFDARADDQVDP